MLEHSNNNPFPSLRLTGGSPDDRAHPDRVSLTEPDGIAQVGRDAPNFQLSEARLKVLLKLLADGLPKSTKNIAKRTGIRSIQDHVNELQNRGVSIKRTCRFIRGKHVFFYTMMGDAEHG
jgi:hypothetical protein